MQSGHAPTLHGVPGSMAGLPLRLSESRRYAGGDSALRAALSDEAQRSIRWHADTQAQINRLRSVDKSPTVGQALADKAGRRSPFARGGRHRVSAVARSASGVWELRTRRGSPCADQVRSPAARRHADG